METENLDSVKSLLADFQRLGEIAIEGLILHSGGCILDVNKTVEDYTGFKREDLIGQSTAIFVPKDIREEVEKIAKEMPETPYEVKFLDKEKAVRWGLVRGKNITHHNNTYRIVSIVDITRIKETEHQITEQNEELRKVNKEMDELLHSSSHDLRSPISSALGLVELLKDDSKSGKEKEEYLNLLETSLERLDGFTKELLDFFKSLRAEGKLKKINIESLLSEVVETIRYSHNAARITFSAEVEQESDFVGDERRIRNIVSNLVSNAVKYHDPSKEKPFVTITATSDKKVLELIITDNGLGIEKKFQDKIFDMFFVASDKNLGSGLGLYLVKENLQSIGGKIHFRSSVRSGSEFHAIIPNMIER